ncbi:MAG: ATP-dependent DNA helicase RecG [bacterium]|nr:ATP-dependent DNA helicase RecG [bacterium]
MKQLGQSSSGHLLHELFRLPVTSVKGIRKGRAGKLENIGVRTVGDLLYHLPRRYEDRRVVHPVSLAKAGVPAFFTVRVVSARLRRIRRLSILDVTVQDDDGGRMVVTWFNQPYLLKTLDQGRRMYIYGAPVMKKGQLKLANPELELEKQGEKDDYLHIKRVVPVYPLTKGISQKIMRRLLYAALQEFVSESPENQSSLVDPLPEGLIKRYGSPPLDRSLWTVHFPEEEEQVAPAKARLVYEELFFMQYRMALEKLKRQKKKTTLVCPGGKMEIKIRSSFGFSLTRAQDRAVKVILKDLESNVPMCRLLAGDVGSGKTCVAALAAARVVDNGYQVAFMVPTEVLARQQYKFLHRVFEKTGVSCGLLLGGMEPADKKACYADIAAGRIRLVVGTHALIQPAVSFKSLGLVIIDEQHKFGVGQRHRLVSKTPVPHQLVMTATPIPRSLALTLFGDYDCTVLDELPPGRKPVKTEVISPRNLPAVYDHLEREVSAGHRVYVVCPVIEAKTDPGSRRAVKAEARDLSQRFDHLVLMHGRMSSEDREKAMKRFRSGGGILVTTSIIEVGLDDPGVTVVLVRGAERFGLAQLHQIRGRVGRGTLPAVCYFVIELDRDESRERVRLLEAVNDGLEVARRDLELRGAGEFFGVRQHGMPGTRVSNPLEHLDILEKARVDAFELLFGPGSPGPVPSLEREARARFIDLENVLFT